LTGSLIRTLVAVTVPVESAVPCAVTHLPTFTDCEVVGCCVVIFVCASTVTVRALVAPADPPNCRAAITSVEPSTDDTVPVANAPPPRCPSPPVGAPLGRCPVGRWPPPAAPPAPPPHCPLTGALTLKEVAVKDVLDDPGDGDDVGDDDDPDDVDGPVATTQSPALIAVTVVVTGWLNVVDGVHVTATWPACWLCTCMVVPAIAAT
jgi:hypothetical protein